MEDIGAYLTKVAAEVHKRSYGLFSLYDIRNYKGEAQASFRADHTPAKAADLLLAKCYNQHKKNA